LSQKILYHICISKEILNSEIRIENHGKSQILTIDTRLPSVNHI
jgi:hypothetical protein